MKYVNGIPVPKVAITQEDVRTINQLSVTVSKSILAESWFGNAYNLQFWKERVQ